MKKTFLGLGLLSVLLWNVPVGVLAQTLPAKVSSYLNGHYSGWRQTAVANGCIAKFKRSLVVGDFDSNGKQDYAVKFIHGRKGYVLAFLAKGAEYNPYLLESGTAASIKRTAFGLGRKGETIQTEEDRYRLDDDSPFVGPCESDAGGFYRFRKGDFKPL